LNKLHETAAAVEPEHDQAPAVHTIVPVVQCCAIFEYAVPYAQVGATVGVFVIVTAALQIPPFGVFCEHPFGQFV